MYTYYCSPHGRRRRGAGDGLAPGDISGAGTDWTHGTDPTNRTWRHADRRVHRDGNELASGHERARRPLCGKTRPLRSPFGGMPAQPSEWRQCGHGTQLSQANQGGGHERGRGPIGRMGRIRRIGRGRTRTVRFATRTSSPLGRTAPSAIAREAEDPCAHDAHPRSATRC